MQKEDIPYQRTIFICTNTREGKIACGNQGRGGTELCEKLKRAVKEAGLKQKIRVARSGCLDLCAKGPNLFMYPEKEWYSNISQEDIPALIQKIAK